MSLKGSCNCEAVTVTIKDTEPVFTKGLEICHCTHCRKATGAIAAFLLFGSPDNIIVEGDTTGYTVKSDKGNPLTRCFCPTCGTPVWGYSLSPETSIWTNGGIFPPASLPAPTEEIWLKNKEKWYTPYPGIQSCETQFD